MKSKIENEVRFLKVYALTTSLLGVAFLFYSYIGNNDTQKFKEIDVERINIVEKNGDLKIVLSNQDRQHPGIVNGKIIERDHPRPPGLLFFNHLGDEMGGLAFGDNGPNGHWGSLTFDKVRGDQTIGFRHLEGENGSYSSALEMWQQPNIPGDVWISKLDSIRKIKDETERKAGLKAMRDNDELMTRRLYLGKTRDNASLLEMLDTKGRTRIVMMVDASGLPKLEFWDETGNVIYSIPENKKLK